MKNEFNSKAGNINTTKALLPTLFDPYVCMAYLPNVGRNSWFAIGYIQTKEGHKFNVLLHQIIASNPGAPLQFASILNVTDITGLKYRGEEIMYAENEVQLSQNKMHNITPTSTFEGDTHFIKMTADFGWASLDFNMDFPGKILLNGGIGVFNFAADVPTAQYSIPWGKGSGWLMLDGVRYEASGTFWFDRQWGFMNNLFGKQFQHPSPDDQWAWMDINLSNGIVLGLWDLELSGVRHSWVTALKPDGTHIVAELEPLSVGAEAIWTSPTSGQQYPTHFNIRIPSLKCELEVISVLDDQEIPSVTEPKYEGFANVKGFYEGENVDGFTMIELMGNWK